MSSNIPSCCTGYTPQVTFFDVVRLKLLLSYCVALSQLGEGKCLDAGVLVQTGVLAGVLIQTDANCCVSTISAFTHPVCGSQTCCAFTAEWNAQVQRTYWAAKSEPGNVMGRREGVINYAGKWLNRSFLFFLSQVVPDKAKHALIRECILENITEILLIGSFETLCLYVNRDY